MTADTFHASLWSALAPAGPELPELTDLHEADIVLVGAGYLGLNTALGLARSGLKVVVVEAQEPGFGASGRNTGFVVPTLKKALAPENVVARYGERRGEAFNAMIGGSGRWLFDLIRDNGIDCAAEETGWMQPAHSRAALAGCDEQTRQWQARGFGVRLLDRDETRAMTGMGDYHGAMLIPSGGQINPLAWARGLARLCLSEGVRIFARSPVTGIEKQGSGWHVKTAKGRVAAGRVVLTTNALAGDLARRVDASIIPTHSFQIATQRFDAGVQERVLPARAPVADTRRHLFAARWSQDGRIVGGGLVYPGPARMARTRARFEKRFARFLPQLGRIRAEYAWFGTVAVTLDALPRLYRLDDGLWAPIGCNGRGVALTASYGRELARFFAGEVSEEDFVVPVTQPEAIPMRAFATLAPYLWLPYSEFRDRRETEAPGAAPSQEMAKAG